MMGAIGFAMARALGARVRFYGTTIELQTPGALYRMVTLHFKRT